MPGSIGQESGDAAGVGSGDSEELHRFGSISDGTSKLDVFPSVIPACKAIGAKFPIRSEVLSRNCGFLVDQKKIVWGQRPSSNYF